MGHISISSYIYDDLVTYVTLFKNMKPTIKIKCDKMITSGQVTLFRNMKLRLQCYIVYEGYIYSIFFGSFFYPEVR